MKGAIYRNHGQEIRTLYPYHEWREVRNRMQEKGPSQETIDAAARMQAYIAEHLTEPITLKQLSVAASYSPYHSAHIFKNLIGVPPFEYIRRLRLSKSALKLRDTEQRVLDVALDFVFDSHEGFTRAFSREFGVTPKQYAKKPNPLRLFMAYNIRDYYPHINQTEGTIMSESSTAIFTQVVERPKRKLLLKCAKTAAEYFAYCEEVGCDVWGILISVKEALYEPVGCWLPPSLRPAGAGEYAQGVEVPFDYSGEVPEGFDLIDLPPCQMMVFQGEPYKDAEFERAITEMWKHIPKFNPRIYGYDWADDAAPRMQLAPEGWRGYIELRPVRAVSKGER